MPHRDKSSDGVNRLPGLSDSQVASRRRQMLDVVNALHLTGVQVDVDIPLIAVIGSQSAGKSSLIEAISGITLPRASGTCTRCPTECRLANSTEPWKCTVSLHFITDSDGQALGHPRNDQFGDVVYDKGQVEDRIRRAQKAILNPGTDAQKFLGDDFDNAGDTSRQELTFSTNNVSLQISGPEVEDLSFVDLPGLIASVGSNENENDIELVKSLVTTYIERDSCIILLTVACETDFQNQGAHRVTKQHDPDGWRTIGVLTKPDRIPSGEEDDWLKYIRNQAEPLQHGWFSVKQPDSRAIAGGITWEDAREKEREYFSTVSPWNALDLEYKNRLGTHKLVDRLSDVLSDRISQRLPMIQDELQKLLADTHTKLLQLPKPPSADPLSEVLFMLSTFTKALGKYIEGTPSADGLLQSIRPACDTFCQAIRATEPDFRPYDRAFASSHEDDHKFVVAEFISNEGSPFSPPDNSRAIFLDDVMKRANEARTRELPAHYPFVVTQQYIVSIVGGWLNPAEVLFREVHKILLKHVKQLVKTQFAQFPLLESRVSAIASDFVQKSAEETLARIHWFLALERRPRTMNEVHYADYRQRFLGHYKAWRPRDTQPPLAQRIAEAAAANDGDDKAALNDVLSGLARLGHGGAQAVDIAKIGAADEYDAALEIMASVRGYFQVAYKRFSDCIPMALDHELVLALDRDQALEKALHAGLGIGGDGGRAQCAEYIREPRHVAERREELMKKRERLETARKQLADVWL
ncbi:P-loop containing nucleoside triphosphate hydrolase protein [Epithele typhae]|uniref:P-loop containing nucleoside triphosphate hydrolase protein n=1 Tax=Epithele typhae TaxID=378194 RepID=UPI00200836DC|nr:P-loop containing nucleoside triphosphate hydrolase protein [Epithele typhae]KAH9925885.1 P-loop containing nucleoside triphosphate hydrolase protein [Epithele typhae]